MQMHACWGPQEGISHGYTRHIQFLHWDSSRLPQLLGARLSLHPGFLAREFQPKTLQRAISSSHYKRITEAAAR